jgi:1,4-alpha-glucan branching enzyme
MSQQQPVQAPLEVYNFVVVCRAAQQVFLLGRFNNWSTSATPMRETEQHVWQLSLELPASDEEFSYFVVDPLFGNGRAPFGNTYQLPGTWAAVVRGRTDEELSPEAHHAYSPVR